MIPREFEYRAPKTLPEALGLLQQFGDEAKLLAGGPAGPLTTCCRAASY